MKLFSIGGADIKCSPFLLIAVPISCLFGKAALLSVTLLSLAVHECAHALVASRIGLRVYSLELQPFGAVSKMDVRSAAPSELAAVWAAGPLASLVMAGMSALFERALPSYAGAGLGITEFNALLAIVNLLPAMPLDGGRILCAAYEGRRGALVFTRVFGVFTGLCFVSVFAFLLVHGLVNVTFAVMGVFLISAALSFREPELPPDTERLIGVGIPLEVSQLAVSEDTRLARALRLLPRGAYAVIVAVDKRGRRTGELEAGEVRSAALRLGANAKLAEAVALKSRGML